MKVLRLARPGGLDHLNVYDGAVGELGAGDLHVRLHACSLNFHDVLVVSGKIPVADGRIPMSDAAGVVVAAGVDVAEFAPGDRVISTFFPDWHSGGPPLRTVAEQRVPGDSVDGYAREEIVAPASWFTPAPPNYSHAQASTLVCAGLTAWRALFEESHLRPGDTVLTQGTGGVSVFALQLAKSVGARVIATSSSSEKLDRLRTLGADHVINYKEHTDWGAVARRYSNGCGVDHVVDVGGAGTLQQSIDACRPGGQISMIGVLA
jgi:NADPH:quinone reductase-like Zn-dependent oxidoreductase